MRILYLTLKKQWFDMIASGVKREEYREIKDYWINRLRDTEYDAIHFRNGYSKGCPAMLIELIGIRECVGRKEWGAPDEPVFILSLGKILTPSPDGR